MRITIAGGSGFLGSRLSDALASQGHEVTQLTRRSGPNTAGRIARRAWTPDGTAGPWVEAIDGVDAVINLAGESIASGRWTPARKASILQSRLLSTRSLVLASQSASRPPSLFISSSASGYYGDRGDELLTEQSTPGRDFLAGVCLAWEAEARKVRERVRLAIVRSGVVLSATDGALPQMLRPFRFFGGGPVGSGDQFMPWIHVDDWVALVLWIVATEGVDGPLNATAPEPVRNRDFAAAAGRVLHRPSWLPAPAFGMRMALGEMADGLLLASARVVPERPRSLGFEFRYPAIGPALESLITA